MTPDNPGFDVHGGADPAELRRLGLRPEQVLDFSANLNPFGPSPAVRLALQSVPIDRYPDRTSSELRQELARRQDVAEEAVLVGNGSSELIWLVGIAYLSAGDSVVILGPAFGEYERSARLMRARIVSCQATHEDGFRPPLAAFERIVTESRPKLAFLASPNNPTGQAIEASQVFALTVRHPQTLFVLDEAYADCVQPSSRSQPDSPANVLRLRSLTKAHALAGLRLGYAIGARAVIATLRAAQPPWSVNALAQVAGLAALNDEGHLRETLPRWSEAKAELIDGLSRAGYAPLPSAVPFFLLPVMDAAQVRSLLLQRGILVRDCASFGLPDHVRISARRREENARLVEALVELRAEIRSCNG